MSCPDGYPEIEEWRAQQAFAAINSQMNEQIAVLNEELAERTFRREIEVVSASPTTLQLIEENQELRERVEELDEAVETYHEAWQDAAVYWKDERDALRACLWQHVASCGHTHGCAVVWRNAPECSLLCVEVRGLLGITDPRNPYGKRP
jgi:regulator of replication initiation timing